MRIGNTNYNVTTKQVLDILRAELKQNGSRLLEKEPKLTNGYWMVCCPYHKNGLERRPSAQFRDKDGLFYCFACKKAHSLPDVIGYCLNTNGYSWMRDHFDSETIASRHVDINFEQEEVEFIDKDELKKYRYFHPYMFERKLSKDVIRKFDVGFDKNTNCLTFPVKDRYGNILFIARRSVEKKFFNYPSGAVKPLYGEYELFREIQHKQINEIYVCESMINCLTLWSWGYYAIALNGTGSKHQYELIKQLPFRKILLALDGDKAGREGTQKLVSALKQHKFISIVQIPKGKDVNDLSKDEFEKLKVDNLFLLGDF